MNEAFVAFVEWLVTCSIPPVCELIPAGGALLPGCWSTPLSAHFPKCSGLPGTGPWTLSAPVRLGRNPQRCDRGGAAEPESKVSRRFIPPVAGGVNIKAGGSYRAADMHLSGKRRRYCGGSVTGTDTKWTGSWTGRFLRFVTILRGIILRALCLRKDRNVFL